MNLFGEIRRRNIVQGVAAYAVVGWLAIQLAIALEASLELPSFVDRWTTLVVIGGLPVAILLSWLFDISLDGAVSLMRTSLQHPISRPLLRQREVHATQPERRVEDL